MSKVFRISEVARELNCSVDRLRDLDRRGVIAPAFRDIHGWWVYTEADLEQLKALLLPPEARRGPGEVVSETEQGPR